MSALKRDFASLFPLWFLLLGSVLTLLPLAARPLPPEGDEALPMTGRELYRAACANCHGENGRGAPASLLGFDVPLPDFTDCSFATREPDPDWVAVAHAGGPVRGFSELMPAFGDVLTVEQLETVVSHVRTFCPDDRWPPGELNLPRPLVTEKAYPEDEAVFSTTIQTEGDDAIESKMVYEKRFGPRNQVEIVMPFGWRDVDVNGSTETSSSLGDLAVGVKRNFHHNLKRGSILSVTGEVLLPTGDEDRGLGKGTAVFEPFLTYGQVLPAEFFLHGQAGLEIPFDRDEADDEAFLRFALGRSFVSGQFGRTWSPMVEFLGSQELVSGADVDWDAVPQTQVTLNTRQHIMLNAGIRAPLNNTEDRDTKVIVYLLWDWFDGGLREGW